MNLKGFKDFNRNLIVEEESNKGEIRDKKSLVYLMFIDRISIALETMRACMPKSIPDDVKDRKPGLVDFLSDFEPSKNIVKVLSPISGLSGDDVEKSKAVHEEIWKNLSEEGARLKGEIRRFYTLYAEAPESKEVESRKEMEERLQKGLRDAKDAYFIANTKASEFVDAAIKSYSTGGKNLIKKINDKKDIAEINSRLSKFFKEVKEKKDKELFESSVYSLLLTEKKNVQGVQSISAENMLSALLSIYNQVKNTVSIFRGTVFEKEVETSAKEYIGKTDLENDIKFLGLDENKSKREGNEGASRLKQISEKVDKMLSQNDALSLTIWRMGISDKFESALTANQYLSDGDKKIARAQSIIGDMVKIVGLKKKAASNDLENIVKRFTDDKKDGKEEDKDERADRVGGGDGITPVLGTDGKEFTENGLKDYTEKSKEFLGKDAVDVSKGMDSSDSAELALRLSFFTGDDYKNDTGKLDIEAINRDMSIFLKARGEDPYFKIYSTN